MYFGDCSVNVNGLTICCNNWPSDTISFPIWSEHLSISELEILHEVQAKVNELAGAETLELPSSLVSVRSNRTDTETVDLFWSDASVSGSDQSSGGSFLSA